MTLARVLLLQNFKVVWGDEYCLKDYIDHDESNLYWWSLLKLLDEPSNAEVEVVVEAEPMEDAMPQTTGNSTSG